MAAYVIVHNEIFDASLFEEFRRQVGATIEASGGRYLVRGGDTEVIDGDWDPERIIIVEFDSAEQAKSWLTSPEYLAIREIRVKSANANVVIVEGVDAARRCDLWVADSLGQLTIRAAPGAGAVTRAAGSRP